MTNKIPQGLIATVAKITAVLLGCESHSQTDVWLDLYDRGAYIVDGKTLRQVQVERVSSLAFDIVEAATKEYQKRYEQ